MGYTVVPERDVCVPEPVNVSLLGKGVFVDVIKALEVRSSGLFRKDPKSNAKCPYN